MKQWKANYKQWPVEWLETPRSQLEYFTKREEFIMRTTMPNTQERWEFWLDFIQVFAHICFLLLATEASQH